METKPDKRNKPHRVVKRVFITAKIQKPDGTIKDLGTIYDKDMRPFHSRLWSLIKSTWRR